MRSRRPLRLLLLFLPAAIGRAEDPDLLHRLIGRDAAARAAARNVIVDSGDRRWIPALVDALFFATAEVRPDVVLCLERLSGEKLGARYRYWVEYVGGREEIRPRAGYREWKASLFARIDPAFGRFLDPSREIAIRAEEIVWGGVRKDEIPALRNPKSVSAADASFLADGETVFGIALGGHYRAYPQRILDWHEMANDRLGERPFTISYCTLCGAAIAYATETSGGGTYLFGSSGLLYRSNKLMYDEATLSLWSNLTGQPVAGPLLGKGISLPLLPLTVTTWKEWRTRHPGTTVVGIDTGFRRDYTPGAAYGRYFASPDTMFPVWKRDGAREPKTWIYGLRQGIAARAYDIETLFLERVVNDRVGSVSVVLVADPSSGSVRSYERRDRVFAEGASPVELVLPETGERWRVEEEALVPVSPGAAPLARYPGHRAFWFGWYAFFPETSVYEGCNTSLPGGR